MRLLKPVLIVCGVLALGVALLGFLFTRVESGHLGVSVTGSTTNGVGAVLVTLEVTNRSPHRVVLPGFCLVESKGTPGLVEVPFADVWIDPGEATSLSVPAPNPPAEWRVAVHYYSESPWNRLKIRLSASSLGARLPDGLVSVQGGREWSPWIGDSSGEPR